jgi:hypothetical protein
LRVFIVQKHVSIVKDVLTETDVIAGVTRTICWNRSFFIVFLSLMQGHFGQITHPFKTEEER